MFFENLEMEDSVALCFVTKRNYVTKSGRASA